MRMSSDDEDISPLWQITVNFAANNRGGHLRSDGEAECLDGEPTGEMPCSAARVRRNDFQTFYCPSE